MNFIKGRKTHPIFPNAISIDLNSNDTADIVAMKVEQKLSGKQFIEGEFEEIKDVKLLENNE
jgi:hypothetical protein